MIAALLCSCGAGDDEGSSDVCTAASAHMEACFGAQAAELFPAEGCDEYSASRVVDLSCDALANSVIDGKADGIIDDVVQEAVWEAVRQAIEAAMNQVISAVMQSLGADNLDDYAFYVIFHDADTQAAAQEMADDLSAVLADRPTFAPLVHEQNGRYYVLHGPCPVNLQSALAELIADVIVTHREIVTLLGGTVTEEPDADGSTTISISLSLSLLPGTISLPASLGCGS
jgi:hypothetical protein